MDNLFKNWLNELFKKRGKNNNDVVKKTLDDFKFSKDFKIINVVGTNGKGSVSKYINDSLIDQGFKVGLFTSPHIYKFNERIKINNIEISDEEFYEISKPLLNVDGLMFFSITYIAAMIYFTKSNVDFVILEAGIGGQKDPTNSIDGDYGIVTSIGEDHMDIFKSRENISKDKAGIINENMEFFLPSAMQDYEKNDFINEASIKGAKIININNNAKTYRERNMLLANGFIKTITGKEISIYNHPFGRTSIKEFNNKNLIIDVAHNFDGIKETVELLKEKGIEYKNVLISMSSNKDDSEIESLFKNKKIFIYQHKGPMPKKIDEYKIKGEVIKDINHFIKNIDEDTLVLGSFYMVGDINV